MEVTGALPLKTPESFQGGYIQITDRFPQKSKTETPVFISPGWSENPKVYEDTIQELLNSGRRVIALSYSGTRRANRQTDYPNLEVSKGEAILEAIKSKGIVSTDVIAHSEGAIGAIVAASLDPSRIRNLILVGPAGFIGRDTFPKLLGRFSVKVIRDHHRLLIDKESRKPMSRFLKEGAKFAVQHPFQGLQEAIAISQVQLEGALRELHNLGIGTAIISGVDDPLFPMERLQQIVKADMIDGFFSVQGGHDEIHLQPRYARAAEELITMLENKQKNKQKV